MHTSDLSLAGRAAFVTSGGGAIGRPIAPCLADMGADVAVLDIVPERCEETAARIAERGPKALPIVDDVMDTQKRSKAGQEPSATYGGTRKTSDGSCV
jgi:NAD(P)-dependent dehydrogenase (short-subunit alcohol dehydrogenase family)